MWNRSMLWPENVVNLHFATCHIVQVSIKPRVLRMGATEATKGSGYYFHRCIDELYPTVNVISSVCKDEPFLI